MLDPYVLAGIAVALAMDAFAISIGISAYLQRVSARQTFRLSFHFGFFQAIMPILGWYTGNLIGDWVIHYDHWLSTGILWAIAGKIVYQNLMATSEDSIPINTSDPKVKSDPTRGMSLLILAVATSIDAYAVGLSFALLGISIWFPSFWIGITASFFTLLGIGIGSLVGKLFGKVMEYLGALLLFFVGLKILFDHLTQQ